jgi:hypothetical protein
MYPFRFGAAVLAATLLLNTLDAQNPGPLTNQRICELVAAGVSKQEILRVIASAPEIDFTFQPAYIEALMKAGVTDDVIRAMAAKQNGGPTQKINSKGQVVTVVQGYSPASGSTPASTMPQTPMSTAPRATASSPNIFREPNLPQTRLQTTGTVSAVLYQGTPVRIRIMQTVSSADAQVGNNVDFQTLDDIRQNGVVVIPKGSTAIATITVAESKKRMARGGKLGMNIDYVRMPNGDQLALRGVQNLKGGGHVGAMTGAMVATAIVFWPASPFFLFMHGKDVTIPEGHEVTVFTNTDYSF